MSKEIKRLANSFKRLIHVLSSGKNKPVKYGSHELFRAEVHILEIIAKNRGITATEITKRMDVTKGAISQIIIKLLKKKLIKKEPRTDDLKIQELFLTPEGESVIKFHTKHERILLVSLEKELESLDGKQIDIFSNIVNKLADHIDRD